MKNLRRTYWDVVALLPPSAKRFLSIYSVLSGVLAILDAVALAGLALVMTPMMNNSVLTVPVLDIQVSGPGLLVVVGGVLALMLVKGLLAVALQWIATRRFAKYELGLGDKLLDAYFNSPWADRLKRNSSELIRIADVGIANTIAGVLLPVSTLVGEAITFITIVAVLFLTQPFIAIITLAYLGIVGAVMYFVVSRQSVVAGRVNRDYSFVVARMLTEMVGALKEITLRNKTAEVAEAVHGNRIHTSRARANIQFLNIVPRYVLESALIGGFVLMGLAGYLLGGFSQAIASIAIFAVAGFRLAPSIQRFQSVISTAAANAPLADVVIADIRSVEEAGAGGVESGLRELPESPQALELDNVLFRYSGDDEPALKNVSLRIPFGATVAFVGSSGAGKSTLVDLILGLMEPSSGSVKIDGVDLADVSKAWRAKVGYVPQDVSLFDASVAQNVALTWGEEFEPEEVRSALAQAQLLEVIESRADGILGKIGERGMSLSGGQRQRLGIARALYSTPFVLVMDEATSALDTATEAAVSSAIKDLHGKVTVLLVAHRLATIRHADIIFFLADGEVRAQGTFEQLLDQVPDFAVQAALAGLGNDESNGNQK